MGNWKIENCDRLPGQARWDFLGFSGLLTVSHNKMVSCRGCIKSFIDKACLSRWLYFGLSLFCMLMDLDCFSVHKHLKNINYIHYPAILTSHLVSSHFPYTFCKLIEMLLQYGVGLESRQKKKPAQGASVSGGCSELILGSLSNDDCNT